MAKVISLCGLICTGKSTYAQKLRKEMKAALLSVDEITLALFHYDVGEMHDTYVERAEKYIYAKAVELTEVGISSVLDIGLWTRAERDEIRAYFAEKGIDFEIHYLTVPGEEWHRRIEKRNADITAGKCRAYYVDSGLAEKCLGLFEPPMADEDIYNVCDN
ncbi:AAA family ATPase [Ruminococcus albus]|uniref:Predicted kinase n=1 Tax=Ruminococcus albus TaxID=1264 RepID=A0A1H7M1H4_RUMAL|nr:ATP-binding protein [Ruminococcus albus]SEL05120.1 Predicted kinase [Ruminococcus albus]